jgi:hypothetical protein
MAIFVYIYVMAKFPQISSIANLHGKTARAVELAITSKSLVKTITPKTLTQAITKR